jgi:hydrogenase expression/formation protein HypC
MCLAVPMQVISKKDAAGVAEIGGVKKEVSFLMLPEAEIGDYVIVHAGFAIQKLNQEEAEERLKLFREMADHQDEFN